MDLISLGVGFVAGGVFGAGALLFYMRWKMMSQLNALQNDMQGMFEVTDDLMSDALQGVDEPGIKDIEEREG